MRQRLDRNRKHSSRLSWRRLRHVSSLQASDSKEPDVLWRTRISTRISSTGFVNNVRKTSVSTTRWSRNSRSLCRSTKISRHTMAGWKSCFVTTCSHAAQRPLVKRSRRSTQRRSLITFCLSSRRVAPTTIHTYMLPMSGHLLGLLEQSNRWR